MSGDRQAAHLLVYTQKVGGSSPSRPTAGQAPFPPMETGPSPCRNYQTCTKYRSAPFPQVAGVHQLVHQVAGKLVSSNA